MRQFTVTGMSCAACQARVENAVKNVPGVSACSVSLLTNSMGVEGSADDAAILQAVKKAGYGASPKGSARQSASAEADALEDKETPVLKRRLLSSAVFLLLLMYFSMGHHMFGWPVPSFFEDNYIALGLLQMLLSSIILLINRRFFVSGFRSVLHGAPNMDTLVSLGSSASFVWSVYALFMMTDAQVRQGSEAASVWMSELYFESAAMILVLITVGKMLEARSKVKTTDALKSLIRLAPKTATILRDGAESTVPVEDVTVGDVFLIRPGESIPVDGVVLEGSTAVNEASLTGESIPVDKGPGDTVSAATVNQSGFLRCRATRVGEDTTLSQIIQLVSDAAATKAPIAKIADKVSGVFVPVVVSIAFITLIVWLILGKAFDFALARAISVLVISCPCALGLATPVAIMVGNGVGARHGILFKTAEAQEETGKVQIVALDKTGTVTSGIPEVTDVIPAPGVSRKELLSFAYALEVKSEHPLARAIVRFAEAENTALQEAEAFRALPGNGITAKVNGSIITGGSIHFISSRHPLSPDFLKAADQLSSDGKTPLAFTQENRLLGMFAVADSVKPESAAAVKELQDMGIRVVMLTGDNSRTAHAIARQAGIEHVIAGVLPDGKDAVIRSLQNSGKVAMVGDGINDAPALTSADIGVAIGAGADVALDAADVVLMNSSLKDVPAALRLSRATLRNIRENLFWAFFYNIIGIPLAAGCYIRLFGWQLNPMFGAAAMSLSSFCVVSNALRLNLCDIYSVKRDRKKSEEISDESFDLLIQKINSNMEEKNMIKTLKVEGMMCHHCEAHTKKALEAIDGVESASADFEKGIAVVNLSKEVDFAVLKAAVEEEGYAVTGIE